MPRVSVIIPAYNAENFIREAVDYARAALAWPLASQPFKEARKVWLYA